MKIKFVVLFVIASLLLTPVARAQQLDKATPEQSSQEEAKAAIAYCRTSLNYHSDHRYFLIANLSDKVDSATLMIDQGEITALENLAVPEEEPFIADKRGDKIKFESSGPVMIHSDRGGDLALSTEQPGVYLAPTDQCGKLLSLAVATHQEVVQEKIRDLKPLKKLIEVGRGLENIAYREDSRKSYTQPTSYSPERSTEDSEIPNPAQDRIPQVRYLSLSSFRRPRVRDHGYMGNSKLKLIGETTSSGAPAGSKLKYGFTHVTGFERISKILREGIKPDRSLQGDFQTSALPIAYLSYGDPGIDEKFSKRVVSRQWDGAKLYLKPSVEYEIDYFSRHGAFSSEKREALGLSKINRQLPQDSALEGGYVAAEGDEGKVTSFLERYYSDGNFRQKVNERWFGRSTREIPNKYLVEAVSRERISPEHISEIGVYSQAKKEELIQNLKKQDITTIDGQSLEEAIFVTEKGADLETSRQVARGYYGNIERSGDNYLLYQQYSQIDEPWGKDTGFSGGKWGERGAGLVIVDPETDEMLLLKRSSWVEEPGRWGIPGGARKKSAGTLADPLPTAVTETKEELGVLPKGKIREAPYVYKEEDFTYHNYVLEIDQSARDSFEPTLNSENTGYKWVKLENMDELNLHYGVENLLQNEGLKKTLASTPTPATSLGSLKSTSTFVDSFRMKVRDFLADIKDKSDSQLERGVDKEGFKSIAQAIREDMDSLEQSLGENLNYPDPVAMVEATYKEGNKLPVEEFESEVYLQSHKAEAKIINNVLDDIPKPARKDLLNVVGADESLISSAQEEMIEDRVYSLETVVQDIRNLRRGDDISRVGANTLIESGVWSDVKGQLFDTVFDPSSLASVFGYEVAEETMEATGELIARVGRRQGDEVKIMMGHAIKYTGYAFYVGIAAKLGWVGVQTYLATESITWAAASVALTAATYAAEFIFAMSVSIIIVALLPLMCNLSINKHLPWCPQHRFTAARRLVFNSKKVREGKNISFYLIDVPRIEKYPLGADINLTLFNWFKRDGKKKETKVKETSCSVRSIGPEMTVCIGEFSPASSQVEPELAGVFGSPYVFYAKYQVTSVPDWFKELRRAVEERGTITVEKDTEDYIVVAKDNKICFQRQETKRSAYWQKSCVKFKQEFEKTGFYVFWDHVSSYNQVQFSVSKENGKIKLTCKDVRKGYSGETKKRCSQISELREGGKIEMFKTSKDTINNILPSEASLMMKLTINTSQGQFVSDRLPFSQGKVIEPEQLQRVN